MFFLRFPRQTDLASSQIAYYCGYGPVCSSSFSTDRQTRLRRAMDNVERIYAVVGVIEDMAETAAVFEAMVPKYFNGLRVSARL